MRFGRRRSGSGEPGDGEQTPLEEAEAAAPAADEPPARSRETPEEGPFDVSEVVLRDLIPSEQPMQITVSTIMGETAKYYALTIDDLCSSSRSRQLVQARQIAMYLCRELTELSLPKIGQQFGGRDHTTVMHADRKIRTQMGEKRSTFNQVTELTNRIKSQASQR